MRDRGFVPAHPRVVRDLSRLVDDLGMDVGAQEPQRFVHGHERALPYGAEACAHERGEQAAAIGHTRAQHNREHESQRRERSKGARRLNNEQLQRLFGQQPRHA